VPPGSPTPTPAPVPADVARLVARYRRRLRTLTFLRGLAWTTATTSVGLLAAVLTDRLLFLDVDERLFLTAATVTISSVCLLLLVLAPLLRSTAAARLAAEIERANPQLQGSLLSTIELSSRDGERCSSELLATLRDRTTVASRTIDIRPLAPARWIRVPVLLATLAMLSLTGYALVDVDAFAQLLARFVQPRREDLPRPSRVTLRVEIPQAAVARGDDVEIRVTVERGSAAWMTFDVRDADASPTGEWKTSRVGAGDDGASELGPGQELVHHLRGVHRDCDVRVECDDYRSDVFRVNTTDPPRPTGFEITCRFPDYAGRDEEVSQKTRGDLAALAGSTAAVRVKSDRPLRSGLLHHVDGRVYESLPGDGPTIVFGGLPIRRNGEYALDIVDAAGVRSTGRLRYEVRALTDAPPSTAILSPRSKETEVEPAGVVEIRYRAEDDVGVADIELLVGEGDETRPRRVRKARPPRQRRRIDVGVYRLPVDSLGLVPGQTVSITLRATDGLGQAATSTSRRLRVAYPPDPPEGRDWLARLDALRRGLRELTRSWEEVDVADGRTETLETAAGPAERVLAIRLFAARLAEVARGLANSLAAPNPDRPALDALAFAIGEFADGDAAGFWSLVVSGVTGSSLDGSAETELTDASERGRKSLEIISIALDTLVSLQELEESLETTRLLAHDTRTLVASLQRTADDDNGDGDEVPSRRIAAISAETVHAAARLSRLAQGPDAMPPTRANELGRLARSLLATVGQDLASASSSLAAGRREATLENLQRAISAAEGRRLEMLDAWRRASIAARRARASLQPSGSVAAKIDTIASTFEATGAAEDPDRLRLRSARRAFALIDHYLGQTRSYEYADFESVSLLGAVREILEQALEDDLEDRSLAAEQRADRRRERAASLRRLANAYRDIREAIEIGHAARTAHWIAGGEEAIAWQLRTTRELHVRRIGFLRRSQTDLVESVELLVSRPPVVADPADGVDPSTDTPRDRARTLSSEALRAAREALDLLTTDPADPRAAAVSARLAAVAFDDMTASLEEARTLALEGARDARRWLAARRGSIVDRLLRLATGWSEHASRLRVVASRIAPSGDDISSLTSRSLVEHDESVRDARELATDMRREADRLVAAGARSARIRAVDRAASRLVGVLTTDLPRAAGDLRATLTTDREDRVLLYSSAAGSLDEAAEKTVALADALALLGEDELAALEGADIDGLVRAARDAARREAPSREEIALRARTLLAAGSTALRTLGARLSESVEKRRLIDHLSAAVASLRLAIERAEGGDAGAGSDALRVGLDHFEAAVALVKKMRGDAEKVLAPGPRDSGTATAPSSEDSVDSELDAARKELEELLATHAAQKEADALLDELLRRESSSPDAEMQRQAADAADEVARAIEEQAMTERRLLEIINRLLVTEKDGRAIAEEERRIEEETREVLAASADGDAMQRLDREFRPRQGTLVDRMTRVVDGFQAIGFKLSILVPDVFHAFQKAAASARPVIESMREARDALGESRPEESVDTLTAANTRLGIFLGHVDATRRRALEAIAAARQRDGGDPGAAMERALRDAKEATRMIASGRLQEAKRRHRATRQSLLAAGRAIRKRLEEISLPDGPEGALLSRLLEEEAARHGLVWTVETRGEKFRSDDDSQDSAADMPFPVAYRELVRAYLQAIAREP